MLPERRVVLPGLTSLTGGALQSKGHPRRSQPFSKHSAQRLGWSAHQAYHQCCLPAGSITGLPVCSIAQLCPAFSHLLVSISASELVSCQ